jgi:hypothetical protein
MAPTSEDLNPLFAAAGRLQQFCTDRQWQFCFIGGLAIQRWGEPRFTKDADLTLLTGFGGEEVFIDALLEQFVPRGAHVREFALRHRVLLLKDASGIPLDIALGALPFEEASIARSSLWEVAPGRHLRTCSADDLVVHKAFASRPQDWVDLENLVMRQGPNLDAKLIMQELAPLAELKEEPAIVDRLRTLFRKYQVAG